MTLRMQQAVIFNSCFICLSFQECWWQSQGACSLKQSFHQVAIVSLALASHHSAAASHSAEELELDSMRTVNDQSQKLNSIRFCTHTQKKVSEKIRYSRRIEHIVLELPKATRVLWLARSYEVRNYSNINQSLLFSSFQVSISYSQSESSKLKARMSLLPRFSEK